MPTVQHHPDLRLQFGYAFHANLVASILNVLLPGAQMTGDNVADRLFRKEFPVLYSPLNKRHNSERYNNDCSSGVFNGDMAYCTETGGAVGSRIIPSGNSSSEIAENQFTCPLPEDYLLQRAGIVRQAQPEVESKTSSERRTLSSIRDGSHIGIAGPDVPGTKESLELSIVDEPPSSWCFLPTNWFGIPSMTRRNVKYDRTTFRILILSGIEKTVSYHS